MKTPMIRQGDVLVRPTHRHVSPAATPISDNGRVILAYGEVTGHAHEVVDSRVQVAEEIADRPTVTDPDPVPNQQLFEEPDGTRLLVVKGPAVLRHEEHGPISLAPGTYEVRRQVEYAPDAIRNVAD